jgi:hypothetical protein
MMEKNNIISKLKLNLFFEKNKLFILSMWKPTLGYGSVVKKWMFPQLEPTPTSMPFYGCLVRLS